MGTLLGEKRIGDASLRAAAGGPVVEETYHYLVQATSKSETRDSVLATSGLPIVGVTLSASGLAVCRSKSAQRDERNPLYWHVTASFSSEVDDNQNQQPDTNPETWVPIYETKFERLTEISSKDRAGNAIVNSAGQPYETGVELARFIPMWDLWQFESSSVTDEQIIDRNETVNSTTFKGRPAKTLLCVVEESSLGFYYGTTRRLTHYVLKYNKEKWTHKRLDVGTAYLDAGGNLKDYRSADGSIILGPLDGAGGKQPAGTAPAIREFDVYDSVDFSTFLRT